MAKYRISEPKYPRGLLIAMDHKLLWMYLKDGYPEEEIVQVSADEGQVD